MDELIEGEIVLGRSRLVAEDTLRVLIKACEAGSCMKLRDERVDLE